MGAERAELKWFCSRCLCDTINGICPVHGALDPEPKSLFMPEVWGKSMVEQMRGAQTFANMLARDRLENPPPPPTRWQVFCWRLESYRDRVRDAWLVLTGQASIADQDD